MSSCVSNNKFGKAARHLFGLAEDIAHLNHGSFGATPREILTAQRAYRDEMEREPSGFMQTRFPALIRRAASILASYVNATADEIALVENATAGVNAIIGSLTFGRLNIAHAAHAVHAVHTVHVINGLIGKHNAIITTAVVVVAQDPLRAEVVGKREREADERENNLHGACVVSEVGGSAAAARVRVMMCTKTKLIRPQV